jgi:hypothetical protein
VTPVKIIFRAKFIYLFIFNPTPKNERGTANRLRTTNSKPPGPISMMLNKKPSLAVSQIWRCTPLLSLWPATATCAIMPSRNHFREANPTYFDFSSFHFTEQDHMLSTAGDAAALTVGTHRVGHLTMCGVGYGNVDLAAYSKGNLAKWMWTLLAFWQIELWQTRNINLAK